MVTKIRAVDGLYLADVIPKVVGAHAKVISVEGPATDWFSGGIDELAIGASCGGVPVGGSAGVAGRLHGAGGAGVLVVCSAEAAVDLGAVVTAVAGGDGVLVEVEVVEVDIVLVVPESTSGIDRGSTPTPELIERTAATPAPPSTTIEAAMTNAALRELHPSWCSLFGRTPSVFPIGAVVGPLVALHAAPSHQRHDLSCGSRYHPGGGGSTSSAST